MGHRNAPVGVVLAGGAGRRMGGGKAVVELHGRPLISYPVGVLQAALGTVAVVAKPASELPPLPGVEIWTEPERPSHPLAGIVHALEGAEGRAVLVAAGDLPFLTRELVKTVAEAPADGCAAVVPRAGGRLQPLLARYEPQALEPLSEALVLDDRLGSLTRVVAALPPCELALDEAEAFFNVNLPEDLLTATAMMDRIDPSAR
ncbi:molybdenum cofactor guanylyltransferase [Conexibacter sp. JD483]|uniref:molybdenum cofactor guanylyltransferase n=1 Tax=unclassified Conexibacter TaxID=2627773 RepID=UPI002719D10E|nr:MULTISPECIES: molybdenum cofactor guanylyltransferase [unclassified Conexibacter]MDO8187143.1 molybdenum cofactor guanylyltransferase [Conexibacter sp. CPCC 205706]MDO8200319.1 molybdenum cofactor guanylyltransferase [Conexibacter sp. CPCC 205762]MDR9368885.1 molybdenum cofactor guanylyltransferase [Conexibacter sp. JD483]